MATDTNTPSLAGRGRRGLKSEWKGRGRKSFWAKWGGPDSDEGGLEPAFNAGGGKKRGNQPEEEGGGEETERKRSCLYLG